MKKYVITITTEADLMILNAGMQPVLEAIRMTELDIKEYTIQEAK